MKHPFIAGNIIVSHRKGFCSPLYVTYVYDSRGRLLKIDQTTIEKLGETFPTCGLPVLLVSHNDTCFTSDKFKMFSESNGIRLMFTDPYHPSSNGQAERTVCMSKVALKKLRTEGKSQVHRFVFSLRTTPHAATGVSLCWVDV